MLIPHQAAKAQSGLPVVFMFRAAAKSQFFVRIHVVETERSLGREDVRNRCLGGEKQCASGGGAQGKFASGNHESPLRGSNFVSQKIVRGAVQIKLGKLDKLILGNLDSAIMGDTTGPNAVNPSGTPNGIRHAIQGGFRSTR